MGKFSDDDKSWGNEHHYLSIKHSRSQMIEHVSRLWSRIAWVRLLADQSSWLILTVTQTLVASIYPAKLVDQDIRLNAFTPCIAFWNFYFGLLQTSCQIPDTATYLHLSNTHNAEAFEPTWPMPALIHHQPRLKPYTPNLQAEGIWPMNNDTRPLDPSPNQTPQPFQLRSPTPNKKSFVSKETKEGPTSKSVKRRS